MAGRRLSRCAGLLDIHRKNLANAASTRFIEGDSATSTHTLAQSRVIYLHRTVRDFLIYSGVWNNVVSKTRFENFDPHLCLLQSYIKQLKLPLKEPERHRRLDEWWPYVVLALTHARYATYSPEYVQPIAMISELDTILRWYWLPRKTDANDNWARSAFGSYEARNKTVYHDPFLSLTTKFGLYQYVEATLNGGNSLQKWPTYPKPCNRISHLPPAHNLPTLLTPPSLYYPPSRRRSKPALYCHFSAPRDHALA